MAWIWLMLAGVCEIVWASGLKESAVFTKPLASVISVVVMLLSFVLLAQAMKSLPLGTSYAVWTGIGAVGTTIWGIARLGEPRDWPRVLCIALIIGGIA